MKSRKIKIQPRIVYRKYDKLIVPEILLKGKWLAEMGFNSGQEVKIELRDDVLIVTREK